MAYMFGIFAVAAGAVSGVTLVHVGIYSWGYWVLLLIANALLAVSFSMARKGW